MMKAKTNGFNKPWVMSFHSSARHTVDQYCWLGRSRKNLETNQPPNMPMKSARMVSSGSIKAVATMRGVTSFLIGSVPSARMASICSVTFMEPSSLAMPEELRPAIISAVNTGPSSRTSEIETSEPV